MSANVTGDECAEDTEGDQREQDVEEVVRHVRVQLVEQEMAGFAKSGKSDQDQHHV